MRKKKRKKSYQAGLRQKVSKGNRLRLNWMIALSVMDKEYISYQDTTPEELIHRFPKAFTFKKCLKALRNHYGSIFGNRGV